MKVLEIISDTNIGGAGRLLVSRLRHSNREKFQSAVLLPKGSQLKEEFEKIGIRVIEMEGCADRSFELSAIARIAKIIRRERPELVNCHGCMSARVAAALCHVPIRLYTRHCAYPVPKYQQSALAKALHGTACSCLSHRVIAVADAARENLVQMGVPENKISTIINGAEALRRMEVTERWEWKEKLGLLQNGQVVGISARLEPCKDHATLLRAAKRLKTRGLPCSFLIVGDGSLREFLEKETARLGLSDCVFFTGFVRDVTPYVNLMDIHVNCSIGTETSSLAISEAMSLGIPCVASNYGGNPYMVQDGINGLLYPMGDDAALADGIARLCTSPRLYQSLSHNAYDRFQRELNAEAMTQKTERLYARLYARLQGYSPNKPLAKLK